MNAVPDNASTPTETPRIALVHDWLNQVGGAEDVLAVLAAHYAAAPIHTSIHDRERMPAAWRRWDIHTSWLDRLPGIYRHHQRYLPLYPLAWSQTHIAGADIILSNKSGFCHGVPFDPAKTMHICYCLAPTRYVWQLDAYLAREGIGRVTRLALGPLMQVLRRWDYAAARRVTHFIAISHDIQQRIRRYYDRDSVVIYPPVDTSRFVPLPDAQVEDYFLVVSRLIPYKRIDLAIEAASRLGVRLKVGGRGRDMQRLRDLAGPTVEFLGFVPDDELPGLFARARAFIFPGFEDFGITPVQSQATGRPVIAYGAGGALDTVLPGITGEHFGEQTVESLMAVMRDFDPNRYDRSHIRQHALQFDNSAFTRQMDAFIEQTWHDFRQQPLPTDA